MGRRQSGAGYPGWTIKDRAAWERMLIGANTDFLDEKSALAGWAPSTHHDARRTVTRFLRWLAPGAELPAEASLADIMTPGLLLAYTRQSLESQKARTTALELQLIAAALQLFDPCRDWTWTRNLIRRLKARARREISPAQPIVHAAELYELGRRLMGEAVGAANGIDASLYRSGLAIALLAVAARRNSSRAPQGPRNRSRSSRRMRLRLANSISIFFRSPRETTQILRGTFRAGVRAASPTG